MRINMESVTKKIICLSLFAILIVAIMIHPINAYSEDSYIISGEIYYIKNYNSGKYLSVGSSLDYDGANVLQWNLTGEEGQKWKAVYMGNGLYKFISMCSSSDRVLDVYPGDDTLGGNIDIYTDYGLDDHRFALERTSKGTYKIIPQCSNYSLYLSVESNGFSNGDNVIQGYSGVKSEWIFEPVYNYSQSLGTQYAISNYNRRLITYPELDNMRGDCANFVSQCMLAGGVHFQGSWWVYKYNNTYLAPVNATELDATWNLADPSPWISAKQFNNFWSSRVTVETYTGSYILSHKSEIYYRPFYKGDVIQILGSNIWGNPGNAWHTMYISAYGTYNGDNTFLLTYHTNDTLNKSLLQLCEEYPNEYFRFFTIN